MQQVLKVTAGACVLIGVAAILGFASNALRSDSLPLLRKPLSKTRAVIGKDQLMARGPIQVPPPKPVVARTGPPATQQGMALVMQKTTRLQQPELVKPESVIAPVALSAHQSAKKTGMPKAEARKPESAAKKIQALFTNLKDAKACFDNKSAIFLDARAVEDYEAEHIAGALWLCFASVEEDYDMVLSKTPKDQLLITYCSDQQCASAIELADELVARGHTRVVIMLEGLPGWKDAGYPVASRKVAVD